MLLPPTDLTPGCTALLASQLSSSWGARYFSGPPKPDTAAWQLSSSNLVDREYLFWPGETWAWFEVLGAPKYMWAITRQDATQITLYKACLVKSRAGNWYCNLVEKHSNAFYLSLSLSSIFPAELRRS